MKKPLVFYRLVGLQAAEARRRSFKQRSFSQQIPNLFTVCSKQTSFNEVGMLLNY